MSCSSRRGSFILLLIVRGGVFQIVDSVHQEGVGMGSFRLLIMFCSSKRGYFILLLIERGVFHIVYSIDQERGGWDLSYC